MNPKKKLTETDIRNQIKEYLQWNGWFVFYHKVKKQNGRQSQKQKMFQENIERHGGAYEVARSLEDAQRIDQFYGKGVG